MLVYIKRLSGTNSSLADSSDGIVNKLIGEGSSSVELDPNNANSKEDNAWVPKDPS